MVRTTRTRKKMKADPSDLESFERTVLMKVRPVINATLSVWNLAVSCGRITHYVELGTDSLFRGMVGRKSACGR